MGKRKKKERKRAKKQNQNQNQPKNKTKNKRETNSVKLRQKKNNRRGKNQCGVVPNVGRGASHCRERIFYATGADTTLDPSLFSAGGGLPAPGSRSAAAWAATGGLTGFVGWARCVACSHLPLPFTSFPLI